MDPARGYVYMLVLLLTWGGVEAACNDGDQCWSTLSGGPTLILGHRGDPYYVPEHSIASYAIALEEGVNFVEPDLVMTKDGYIVCAHGIQLNETTNVASNSSYQDRLRNSYQVDGTLPLLTDWFISDFTYEELQTLRLKQATYVGLSRNHVFDGYFRIPLFEDVIDYVQQRARELNITVGIIPEIKHSSFFQDINAKNGDPWHFEDKVLKILQEKGYDSYGNNVTGSVVIQSAEEENLKYIRSSSHIQLMQLMFDSSSTMGNTGNFFDWMLTQQGLKNISEYATYIGIKKDFLLYDQARVWAEHPVSDTGIPFAGSDHHLAGFGEYLRPSQIIPLAHSLGLLVGIYTLRNGREDPIVAQVERTLILANGGVPVPQGQDMGYQLQLTQLMRMGVDAMFVEKAGPAIYARNALIDKLKRYQTDDPSSRIEYWRRLALGSIVFTMVLVSCLLFWLWRVSGQKRRLITQAQQRSEHESTIVSLMSDTQGHPDSAIASQSSTPDALVLSAALAHRRLRHEHEYEHEHGVEAQTQKRGLTDAEDYDSDIEP